MNCGDKVHTHDNPRHIGRVEAVWTHQVKVRWANRWVEYLKPNELVVVERAPSVAAARLPPNTVALSPLRRLQQSALPPVTQD